MNFGFQHDEITKLRPQRITVKGSKYAGCIFQKSSLFSHCCMKLRMGDHVSSYYTEF